MYQVKRALAMLLLGVVTSGFAMTLLPESADATSRSRSCKKPNCKKLNKEQNRVSAVQKLLNLFKQKRLYGRTRSSTVCMITPNKNGNQLWSDRPLFVWQNAPVSQIRVQLERGGKVVWQKKLAETQSSAVYVGVPLQPGKTYEIVLLDHQGKAFNKDKDMLPKFTPLDVAKRTHITNQLNAIEHRLLAKQETIEDIMTAKVEYLLKGNYISDAVQIVYSAQDKAPELMEVTQQIAEMSCTGKSSPNALQ